MKICAAQLEPKAGDVEFNIGEHIKLINKAVAFGVDLILFPELSLTGYEPQLAKTLSCDINDKRLDPLQKISDENNIIICVGLPIKQTEGSLIGLVTLQPCKARTLYAKQLLHEDELPFFKAGKEQVYINHNDAILAPAICFESLQASHAQEAKKHGTNIYLATVAKDKLGIQKGYKHYSSISNSYRFITLMANNYGICDNFISFGSSAVWNQDGQCLAKLGESENGLVGIDTQSGKTFIVN